MSEENSNGKKLRQKVKADLKTGCDVTVNERKNINKRLEDPEALREEMESRWKEAEKRCKDKKDKTALTFIEEYKKAFFVFINNFESIRRRFEKFGDDKIELNLYFIKIKHPCFHIDMDSNVIASNPLVYPDSDSSHVELSVGLYKTWEKLRGELYSVRDLKDIYLRAFFNELKDSFGKHKEQLELVRGIVPLYFSEFKFNVPPHLNVRIAWNLEEASLGFYYTDILADLDIQVLPITVEENNAECLPILVSAEEEDVGEISINDILGKLEDRLGNVGGEVETALTSKVMIPISVAPDYLLCDSFMTFTQQGKEDKFSIDSIKTITDEVICDVISKITTGVEHHASGGDSKLKEIRDICEKRSRAWTISDLLGMKPLNGERVRFDKDRDKDLFLKYVEEFKAFKKRQLK